MTTLGLFIIAVCAWTAGLLIAFTPWRMLQVKSRTYYHLKSSPDHICYVTHVRGLKVKFCYYMDMPWQAYLHEDIEEMGRFMFSTIYQKCENQNLPLGVKL